MKVPRWIGLAFLAIGVIGLIYSVAQGTGSVGLLLIFPYVSTSGAVGAISGLCIMMGLILSFFSFSGLIKNEDGGTNGSSSDHGKKMGGFILIGPIPIIIGSDRKTTLLSALGGIALLVAMLMIYLIVLR